MVFVAKSNSLRHEAMVSIWKHATVLGRFFVVVIVVCGLVAAVLVAHSLMGPANG